MFMHAIHKAIMLRSLHVRGKRKVMPNSGVEFCLGGKEVVDY